MDGRARIRPVVSLLDAFARRDTDALVAVMTEDVDLRPSAFITGTGEYIGHEAVRRGMADLVEQFQAARETVHLTTRAHYIDTAQENTVLTLADITITRANGETFGTPIAYLWTLRDGRVSKVRTWLDHVKGLAQLADPVEVSPSG
jgi:ketosteroid isomerase-like protein